MLDDLEGFDESNSFLDELEELGMEEEEEVQEVGEPIIIPGEGKLFGMSPIQRFVIAFEFFFLASILSLLALMVFDKITPPF